MFLNALGDFAILLILGIAGWYFFALLRAPVAPLLGAFTVIGIMRAAGIDLPPSPFFLSPMVQIAVGLFVGSQITRETVWELKTVIIPAFIIATWALGVVFVVGGFLASVTHLDLYTAMLSSSMGGLPEMAVLAMATNTEVAVVIAMFVFRLVVSLFAFPLIFKNWVAHNLTESNNNGVKGANIETDGVTYNIQYLRDFLFDAKARQKTISRFRTGINILLTGKPSPEQLHAWGRILFALAMTGSGAIIFNQLGVPAGMMVGAMFFSVTASLAGARVHFRSAGVFGILLVGVGIMIADNISSRTLDVLLHNNLLWPMLLSTILIVMSSFLVAYIIHKLSGWDYPTSFLAAAPAGLTLMTALALSYGKNPLHVSTLHLCRLLVLKTAVPLIFMFMI